MSARRFLPVFEKAIGDSEDTILQFAAELAEACEHLALGDNADLASSFAARAHQLITGVREVRRQRRQRKAPGESKPRPPVIDLAEHPSLASRRSRRARDSANDEVTS